MLSRITLIGTVKEIKKDHKNNGYILLSTTRPFPDDNFQIQKDKVWIKIWDGYFKSLEDYINLNQLIFIEGRLESHSEPELQNYVFAERIEKIS